MHTDTPFCCPHPASSPVMLVGGPAPPCFPAPARHLYVHFTTFATWTLMCPLRHHRCSAPSIFACVVCNPPPHTPLSPLLPCPQYLHLRRGKLPAQSHTLVPLQSRCGMNVKSVEAEWCSFRSEHT